MVSTWCGLPLRVSPSGPGAHSGKVRDPCRGGSRYVKKVPLASLKMENVSSQEGGKDPRGGGIFFPRGGRASRGGKGRVGFPGKRGYRKVQSLHRRRNYGENAKGG